MADDIKSTDSDLSGIKFGLDTSGNTPTIVVEGVRNIGLKQPVTQERFNELIETMGDKMTSILSIVEDACRSLRDLMNEMSDDEKLIATYLIEHTTWQYAVASDTPLFMFNPRHLPDEVVVDNKSNTVEGAFTKKKGGFVSVRKGGKKYWEKKK
tara:strand:- start:372 stop:833 length:462 start_codon:yes stop_codon:yes gene_type:complete